MAKGYWINMFRSIKDPAKVDAYRKLAGPVLGSAPAEEFIARVGDLEREPDLRSLTTLLRPEV